MKENTKAKWIVGIAGVALSAFVVGQLDNPNPSSNTGTLAVEVNDKISDREKELVKLDWSDFSVKATNDEGDYQNDRTTRRSKEE